MKAWICVIAILCAGFCLATAAHAQTESERMDNLMALYMIRASEPMCGFKMTDEQRAEVLKACRFLEGQLKLSSEKADELYKKVVQSMETQKAGGLCDPNGEWGRAFNQTLENFAKSGAAPNAPAATSSTPAPAPLPPASASSPSPSSVPPAQSKLTGLDAGKQLVGNTVSGRRDRKDFSDYYAPDGKVVAVEAGEMETGRWAVEGESICTEFSSEGKICYRLEVLGDSATFTDRDGSGYRGTILQGNPFHL